MKLLEKTLNSDPLYSTTFSTMTRRTDFRRETENSVQNSVKEMGISLLTSAGFRLDVRWDLKVTEFLWRLQPPKFLVFFFSSIANIWLSVKRIMHRLCGPNERHNMGRKNSDLFSSVCYLVYLLCVLEEGY